MGLGNPGPVYDGTRHNLGYVAVRHVARELGLPRFRRARHGLATTGSRDPGDGRGRGRGSGQPEGALTLLLPTTYMNGSGLAVVAALRGHVLPPADLIVVHDDLDLPAGRLKLRLGGSSGGHRGVASIIGELGRDAFVRVKIGIGRPPAGVDPVDFVLERPSPTEEKILSEAALRAAEAVLAVLREGLGEAMSRFNRTPDDTSAGGVVSC